MTTYLKQPPSLHTVWSHSHSLVHYCDTLWAMTITSSIMRDIWCDQLCVCGCVQLHDYAGDVWGEVSLGVQRRLVDGKHVGEELAERNVRQGLWALSLDYNPLLTHSHVCVSGTERAPCREIPTVTQRHLDPLNTHCGGSLKNVVDNFHSSLQSDSKKPLDCRLIEFSDLLEESVTIYCQTISETEELKSLLGSHCSFKRSGNCLPFSLETDNSLMVQSTAATAQRNKVYNTTKLKDQLKAHSYLSVGASSVFSVHSWCAWQNISNECTVSGNRWAARHDSGSVCCQSPRVKAKETAKKCGSEWECGCMRGFVCVPVASKAIRNSVPLTEEVFSPVTPPTFTLGQS